MTRSQGDPAAVTRRSGRRPGKPQTRGAIVAAARDAFAQRGYDGTSIRQIAAAAGVDPALVHHYFGTKDQLFAAIVDFPVDPTEYLPGIVAGGPGHVGERLVRVFVSVWDSPTGTAGVALVRSAVTSDVAAALMREFLTTQILRRMTSLLAIDETEAPLRSALIASQMAGLALTRYVLKVEPLASAEPETVVAAIAPTIQRYLTGELSATAA